MGSKRIGLARMEALMENLKRELSMQGSTVVGTKRKAIALTNAATTARALLANESGAFVTLDPSTDTATTITVTMPSPAAGLSFDFLIINDQVNAGSDIILQTTGNACDFEGAFLCSDGAVDIAATVASTSKITIDATNVKTVFGTQISALSDGTDWYIKVVHPQDAKDCVASAAGAGVQYVLVATV
jgi:hypothetical protein